MDDMKKHSIQPTVVTYTIAIAACGYGRQVTRALELLREMEAQGVYPNEVCYNTAIWCCNRNKRYDDAFALQREMERKGMVSNNPPSHRMVMGTESSSHEAIRVVAQGEDDSGISEGMLTPTSHPY